MVRMKGQAYVIPETLIDILQLLSFVALFIGTFLIFTNYNITVKSSLEDRETFDFMNVILGDRCILFEREGNFYRGIFDAEKLKSSNLCIEHNKFSLKIESIDGKIFSFGDCKKERYYLPITIKDGEKFVLGKMVVCY